MIGRNNLEAFFSYLSGLHEHNYKSIIELTNSYKEAIAMFVELVEAKILHLNLIMKQNKQNILLFF